MIDLCYSPIDICAGQANRLDCDGNVLNGATDVIVSCAFVDVNIVPIEGEDRDQSDPNGSGGYCAERTISAEIQGYEVEIVLCSRTDVALMEMLGLFDVVYDAGGNAVGIKAKCCVEEECLCDPGEETCSNPGVALHLWHVAWLGRKRHPDWKWVVEHFPKVVFDPSQLEVQRNSEFNTYTITGRADCNENYGQGPGGIYPDTDGLDRCWAETVTNLAPEGMCSCDMCGYAQAGQALGN
jgi:hypothetical protein